MEMAWKARWGKWREFKREKNSGIQYHQPHDELATICVGGHLGPIFATSTFDFTSVEDGRTRFQGQMIDGQAPFAGIYTRLHNPTTQDLADKLVRLHATHMLKKDGKPDEPDNVSGLFFPSGMSAIATTIMCMGGYGDSIIRGNVLYGCTDDMFQFRLIRYGLNAYSVDTTDPGQIEDYLKKDRSVVAVFIETPANPTLAVSDIPAISELCDRYEVPLIVDNTFASPYLQQPMRMGADIVIESTTKYINGHSTDVGGVVIGPSDFIYGFLFHYYKDLGGTPNPSGAFRTNIGLRDLHVRMDRHCDNAEAIVTYLQESGSVVERIIYPGLPDFPGREAAKRQMRRSGGMVAFELKGGTEAGIRMMNFFGNRANNTCIHLAVSLGSSTTYIEHPDSMTHSGIPEDLRLKKGITPGLVRLSVGIEGKRQIISDLDRAFQVLK